PVAADDFYYARVSAVGGAGFFATYLLQIDVTDAAAPAVVSTTLPVDPAGGAALRYDGGNDYVTVPHSAYFDAIETRGRVTVEAWVRVDGYVGGWFPIADKYEATGDWGWMFEVNQSTGLTLWSQANVNVASGYVPPLGVWTHVAVSYDQAAGHAVFYANGLQV